MSLISLESMIFKKNNNKQKNKKTQKIQINHIIFYATLLSYFHASPLIPLLPSSALAIKQDITDVQRG